MSETATPTPRTDALFVKQNVEDWNTGRRTVAFMDLARTLERELASAPGNQKVREDDGAVEITTIRWRDASKENPPEPHKSYEAKLKDGRRGQYYYGNRPGIKDELEWYYYQNSAVAPVTHFALVESVTTTEALTLLAPDTRTEYDKAVEALAPYLPLWVGWVAIHDQAHVQGLVLFDKKPELSKMGPWWNAAKRAEASEVSPLCLPLTDWKTSLRKIENGKVVPHV